MGNLKRIPDFEQMLKVLRREVPDRPVLFELFMCDNVYAHFTGVQRDPNWSNLEYLQWTVDAFAAGGYDYATVTPNEMQFPKRSHASAETISLNDSGLISDWESFEAYQWPDPDAFDYSDLGKLRLPGNMKLMIMGPDGFLEAVTAIVGFDNLCMMIYDEPELVEKIFDKVGNCLLRYFEHCLEYDSVGAILSTDDWGFNTQTFLSPEHMRKYVFPWHKKLAEMTHRTGRPILLHSCGYMKDVMDDIIDDMKFEAKHSYEDNIHPVEEACKLWGDRIAIMGGIDVDFLIRATPDEIRERSKALVAYGQTHGGYALGSGNSIPDYIPLPNYLAMLEAAKLEA